MELNFSKDGGTACGANKVSFEVPHHNQLECTEEQHLVDDCNNNIRSETIIISIDTAIEMIGMGRFQNLVLISSGLCFAADAMQVTLLSFLALMIKNEWNLTHEETEFITSSLFAGSLLGTLILGPLADIKGRRPIWLFSAFTISAFGVGTAVATNYRMMLATIFMVGVGAGGLTVPFDILAEFLPAASRGRNLLMIEYFWTLGVLYVIAVAYLTMQPDHVNWRCLTTLSAAPCAVALVMGYFLVPESARWLVNEGRPQEAMDILRKAASVNGLHCHDLFPDDVQMSDDVEEKHGTILDLFKPKWIYISIRLWGAWAAFAFGYYGTLLANTKVFANQNDRTASHASVSFDFLAIFISSSAEFIGTTMVILAVDRVGRIPSQVLAYSFAGLSVCLLCLFAEVKIPQLSLISVGFCARVFEMAGTCVTWVSTAEILPTEVRSTGHSTANAMARLGAFFSPFLVEGETPLPRVGVIMLLVHIVTVLCVLRLPETNGRDMGGPSDDEEDEDAGRSLLIVGGNATE